MKKFTYANQLVLIGTIIDENEYGYTVEYLDETVVKGFKDTMFLEKELTVVEDVKDGLTTIVDYNDKQWTGVKVDGKKYFYLVFENTANKIEVRKFERFIADNKYDASYGQEILASRYYWEIDKETLKGSGGINKKIMKVVQQFIK